MAHAKRMHDWDQTSLIWSAIANTVRDSKRNPKPFLPDVVHPLRQKKQTKPVKSWDEMGRFFEGG
jgi:hypothetical protein